MVTVVEASRGKLIAKSGFKGYDICHNSYVGCEFGCTYCYVRFFVKDKNHEWGDFVRERKHIKDKLHDEVLKYPGKRIVLGTMTDPYQPQERKSRLTRAALQIINDTGDFNKVGIFTRSPIILDDIELIKKLPRARVHFTITPYPREILKLLEPVPIMTQRRFDTVTKLKEAGIRVHVNVAPILPIWSEQYTEQFAEKLSIIGVDEFFVDPMQPYRESFRAVFGAVQNRPEWPQVKQIIGDKNRYLEWKEQQWHKWKVAWDEYDNGKTLAIWSDHENKIWRNIRTGAQMDHNKYGDDLEN